MRAFGFVLPWVLLVVGCAASPPPVASSGTSTATVAVAPTTERVPVTIVLHGESLTDDYGWLRNKSDPKVLRHLEAENAYTTATLSRTSELRARLYDEMLARIKQTDQTVPAPFGPWEYYNRTVEGQPFKIHCRRPAGKLGPETILIDVNQLAAGKSYAALGAFQPSPSHRRLAYSVDFDGGERYSLRFRDLEHGTDLPDRIEGTYYSGGWAADDRTYFYVTVDDAMRPYKVFRHQVGTSSAADVLVYHEADEHFNVEVNLLRSRRYLAIGSASAVTSETRLIDAARPQQPPRLFAPRKAGVEYAVDHQPGHFFIVSNEGAVNFQLFEATEKRIERSAWKVRIAERPEVTLEGVDAFKNQLVVHQRAQGLPQLRILDTHKGSGDRVVPMKDPTYAVYPEANFELERGQFRFGYSSPITPRSVLDVDLARGTQQLLKENEVIGYDRSRYRAERITARAPDGVEIPISLAYAASTPRDGSAPLLLDGYGAYGIPNDADFDSDHLSLLDRGFVYAIAHVRGGGENGRHWKDDGKLAKKPNTFTDFIACAERLIADRWTSADRLAIYGASAGGLLIGSVLNHRPDLFRAAIAEVPFVDLINTMSDATLPLTVIEWEEWGNPSVEADYRVMRSYSPYDNVQHQNYPDILALAGLNDPRVGYWEPAKWIAKLRATATGGTFLLKTNLGAGHGGASGRYERLRETAWKWAFLIDRVGRVSSGAPSGTPPPPATSRKE